MAKISTLVDGFVTQNNTLWTYSGTAAVSSAQLVLVPTTGYSNKIDSVATYDLTSSAIYVQVLSAPIGNGGIDTYLKLYNGTNEISFFVEAGNLYMNESVSGTPNTTSVTYSATTHAWWRIRHDGTNLLWETAPDGTTWTTRRTKLPGATWSAVTAQLMAGYFGTEPTPGQSIFDNVNTPPPVVLTAQPGGANPASVASSLTTRTQLTVTPGSAVCAGATDTVNTGFTLNVLGAAANPAKSVVWAGPAPILIAAYIVSSAGANSNTLTTPSFTVPNGTDVVVKMTTWDTAVSMGSVTGGSQTWTSQTVEAPGGFNGWAGITTATIAGSPGPMTVAATPSGSSQHNMVVECWSNAQLAATPATAAAANATGSVNITTAAPNSVVSWCGVDDNSVDPAARVYLGSAVEETVFDGHIGSNSVQYFAYQQAAAAGLQAFGLSAPAGLKWVTAGIEIQAAGTGTTLTAQPGGSQSGQTSDTFTQGTALAVQPGTALPRGASSSLPTGSVLTAAPAGASPTAVSCTVTLGVGLTASSGSAATSATLPSAAVGVLAVVAPAATIAASVAAALTAAISFTAVPGSTAPGASPAQQVTGTALAGQPGGTTTASVPAVLAAAITLSPASGVALGGGCLTAAVSATAVTTMPGVALPGICVSLLVSSTALTAWPGLSGLAGNQATFTSWQTLNAIPGGDLAGSTCVAFGGAAAVLIRPGILTPGTARSNPEAGVLPYPRLTAGTARGPIYGGG